MIVLDTNVLSAMMQGVPDPLVVTWLDSLPPESIWTTSITVFEVRFGLESLAKGKRRRLLESAFDTMIEVDLEGRILPFDETASQAAGRIAAEGRRLGRSIEIRDVQIAGIAAARKAAIATGSVRHFQDLGPELIDPWSWQSKPGR